VQGALDGLGAAHVDAMVVPAVASTWAQRRRIVAGMDALGLPAIYEAPIFTDVGGLMHFGAINSEDTNARLAQIIAKVAAGDNAGDIPASQPTRFELVINMKAANALRYRINAKVMRRADRIIE
jgi:putative ABC transport system substrate-binding protein